MRDIPELNVAWTFATHRCSTTAVSNKVRILIMIDVNQVQFKCVLVAKVKVMLDVDELPSTVPVSHRPQVISYIVREFNETANLLLSRIACRTVVVADGDDNVVIDPSGNDAIGPAELDGSPVNYGCGSSDRIICFDVPTIRRCRWLEEYLDVAIDSAGRIISNLDPTLGRIASRLSQRSIGKVNLTGSVVTYRRARLLQC